MSTSSREIRVSVFKRADENIWYMQYRHPTTGRKIQKTTKETIKRDALKKAGQWETDLREGRMKKQGNITWKEFRQRYEDEVVASLADTTDGKIASVFNSIETHIHPQRLADLDDDALSAYQKKLRDGKRSENTIKGHLAHIRSALAWAHDLGLINSIPKIPKTQRAKATRLMKGRAPTLEEFERMIDKVQAGLLSEGKEPKQAKEKPKPKRKRSEKAIKEEKERLIKKAKEVAPSWKHLLRGLWWSGLRLSESLDLHWTDRSRLSVDLSCKHPMLHVPADKEKGNKDRLMPMAPEFAEFLLAVPPRRRIGFVFNPRPQRVDKKTGSRLGAQQVGHMITRIGRAAKVKVSDEGKPLKFASAHDLRRAFGTRWAARVMPQVLMELMRHESIETTMRFYISRNAQATADILWAAHKTATAKQELGGTLGGSRKKAGKKST